MKEARAIISMPDTSLLETAAILEEERATLEISHEYDGTLSDVLLVSMRLANSVAVQGHAEEFAFDKPIRQHGTYVLPNFTTRVILGLLMLLHPAHAVRPAFLRRVVSA